MERDPSLTSANVAHSVISRPSPGTSFTRTSQTVEAMPMLDMYSNADPGLDVYSNVNSQASPHKMTDIYDQSTTTTAIDDTVHYLSPASPLSAKSAYEGDYMYETPGYLRFLQDIGRVGEYHSTSSSTVSCTKPKIQRTLAVIKPEAMQFKDVVVQAIVDAGFSIISTRTVHFTPEQVSEIYAKHYGSPAFPLMVVSMSVGPVLTLSLAAEDSVKKWNELIGPDKALHAEWFYPMSRRVRFGIRATMPNALHASESYIDANKENRYVYPESILEPLVSDEDEVCDFCNLYVNPTLVKGLTEVVRVKPIDPVLYLAEWLLLNNPYQPRFAPDIAVLPT